MGRKSKESLGRSLIKDRFGATRGKRKVDNNSMLHTTEINDGYEWGRLNLQSVTAESSLQEFLSTAELAGKEFTAEKLNLSVANSAPVLVGKMMTKDHKKQSLTIPRRPAWVTGVSPSEQALKEREAFLEWKRNLVNLQESDGAALTPYERNIELWKQLWQTLEKSDLLLILLDARNPLLFRCEDLEKAAKENNAQCVLLLNKADLIGEMERKLWAQYFDKKGIRIAFFSASTESKDSENPLKNLNKSEESDEGYDASDSDNEITDENDTRNTDDGSNLNESYKAIEIPNETNLESIENVISNTQSEHTKDIETNQTDTDTGTHQSSNGTTEKNIAIKDVNSCTNIEVKPIKLDINTFKCLDSIESNEIASTSKCNKKLYNEMERKQSDEIEEKLIKSEIDVANSSNDVEDSLRINVNISKESIENEEGTEQKINKDHLSIRDDSVNKCRVTFEDDLKLVDEKITEKEYEVKSSEIDEDTFAARPNEIEEENGVKNSHFILERNGLINMLKRIPVNEMKSPPRLTVGLIGYPNVGKSSTVNTLMQTKKVSVSAMPGHTRHVQSLMLDDMLLLDCPGLVLPTYAVTHDLLLTAVLPIDQMTSYELAIQRLIELVGKETLKNRYGLLLPEQSGPFLPQHLLSAHAYNRGFMTAAGRPDESRSARLLLKQASSGKLKWAELPPGTTRVQQKTFEVNTTRKPTPLEARLVQGWSSAAADIDRNFFALNKATAHIKGIPAPGISGVNVQSEESSSEKPWKKHNKHANKNKKEKLRKTYWQLDKH